MYLSHLEVGTEHRIKVHLDVWNYLGLHTIKKSAFMIRYGKAVIA